MKKLQSFNRIPVQKGVKFMAKEAIRDEMFKINPNTGNLVVTRNSVAEYTGAPQPLWAIVPEDPGAAERAAASLNNREHIISGSRKAKTKTE